MITVRKISERPECVLFSKEMLEDFEKDLLKNRDKTIVELRNEKSEIEPGVVTEKDLENSELILSKEEEYILDKLRVYGSIRLYLSEE